jgi:hypothetical protein
MTQQMQREAIVLIASAAVFIRAVFPTQIINQATKKPYQSQVKAHLCCVAFGVFFLLVWYGIYREGR